MHAAWGPLERETPALLLIALIGSKRDVLYYVSEHLHAVGQVGTPEEFGIEQRQVNGVREILSLRGQMTWKKGERHNPSCVLHIR